jgi:hypothetical protein
VLLLLVVLVLLVVVVVVVLLLLLVLRAVARAAGLRAVVTLFCRGAGEGQQARSPVAGRRWRTGPRRERAAGGAAVARWQRRGVCVASAALAAQRRRLVAAQGRRGAAQGAQGGAQAEPA